MYNAQVNLYKETSLIAAWFRPVARGVRRVRMHPLRLPAMHVDVPLLSCRAHAHAVAHEIATHSFSPRMRNSPLCQRKYPPTLGPGYGPVVV